jgi:hypothetical protein
LSSLKKKKKTTEAPTPPSRPWWFARKDLWGTSIDLSVLEKAGERNKVGKKNVEIRSLFFDCTFHCYI